MAVPADARGVDDDGDDDDADVNAVPIVADDDNTNPTSTCKLRRAAT